MSTITDKVANEGPENKRERLAQLLRARAQQQPKRFPLSFAQRRLWFLDELEGGSTISYNIPVVLGLRGQLDRQVMERCFNEIIRRHESLRTTFETNRATGDSEQVIHHSTSFRFESIDLSDTPEGRRLERARFLANDEAQRPFNLRTGPLLRASLLRFADNDHVLLLTIHHIVSDGWSVGVIIKELKALYEAFTRGEKSHLPELPIQYADFAHWQRNRMQGEVLERQLGYWRTQLAGQLPVLELPTSRPRPARHTQNGAVQVWELPREITDGVKSLSQAEGVTLFMTLLAAFKVLLLRYTGQQDILVGTPIANRNRTEVEGLIGLFINTLVLRTDLSGDPSFRELLARVRELALEGYANQDVPFEKLVEELQPERDLSRTPLFQVMFVMQNNPMPELKMGSVSMSPLIIEGATSKFDITLSIMEEADANMSGWLEYNTDLFDQPMIESMIGHYNTLLRSIITDADQRVSRLPMLTDAERKRLLVEFNDTACDYPLNKCVHHLFEAQAERTPDAVAVIYEGQNLTYGELNRKASRIARHLQALGVGPESLVGISMERSIEMVLAIFGILKAGGAYVPLDPTYPKDRLAFMAEDSGVKMILTQSHLVQQLPEMSVTTLCLDREWEPIVAIDNDSPSPGDLQRGAVVAENVAYVIYTSGSTGKPKGVMTSHDAVANMILWMQAAYEMTPADRLLQKTAFSFDASAWEFFWPLITGATLVVARPYAEKDGDYMVKTLQEHGVTVLQLVPSLLRMLVEQEGFEKCRSLRHVFCGGEALPGAVCDRFFERLPNARLTNVYGPTETTMHVTVWECRQGGEERIVPIGRPVGNTQAYILDENMQPVPTGLPGELCIGGVQVARGYLNRPELTAERFIADPFSNQEGRKLYRTGDLTRFRPDGGIEFLGRIDHQVKVRGYRIELGEIESVLRQHNSISDAIVMAREDVPGDKRLVGYVVGKSDQKLKISELHNHLLAKLPDYMAPSAFVVLDRMPLLSNGKVDRNALPAPEYSRQVLAEEYVAPRDEVEQSLALIFAEVLGLDTIGVHDNFFLLGGHSLSATQVIIRLREKLHADVPLRRIFEEPTVSGLAAAVEEFKTRPQDDRIEVISRDSDEDAEPLSAMLEQMTKEELQALLMDVTGKKKG
jgi:amino acid adenylation domain-containing protein